MNGFDTTIENVFTPNEMEYVIHCYKNKLNPAVVFGSSGGNTEVDKQIRDASGYFIPDYNVIVERFKNITSSITGIPVSHQEKPNFIKYKKGGFYKAHFDGFNDGESGKQKMNPDGQRMFTSILYLNDDFEGGKLYFPKFGFTYVPQKLAGVFFISDGEKWRHGITSVESGSRSTLLYMHTTQHEHVDPDLD